MGSLNKVIAIGNLGRDCEMRYTPGGQAVGTFSIACTEAWTDRESGEKKERTEWIRCVLWGKQAESLQEYLKKGKQVAIEGSMQTRSWDDKDGNKKWMTEVKVHRVTLLGGGPRSDRGRDEQPARNDDAGAQPEYAADPSAMTPVTDDYIPF